MEHDLDASVDDLAFEHPASVPHDTHLELSLDERDQIQEFTRFLDSVGIPSEWAPIDVIRRDAVQSPRCLTHPNPMETPSSDVNTQSFHSRLPPTPQTVQHMTTFPDFEPSHVRNKFAKFTVTEEERLHMTHELEGFRSDLRDFFLPSRHILTRYLGSFFEGFHTPLSFIHIPTFQISNQTVDTALAMMAAGAQYRFEHDNANRFFHASRSILMRRIARVNGEDIASSLMADIPQTAPTTESEVQPNDECIHLVQCLLILMGYGSWGNRSLLNEAFCLHRLLAQYLRICGMREPPISRKLSWAEWIRNESARRTKLVSFCFLNIYTVAYNSAATIRSNEIFLRLPCTTREWNATSAREWEVVRCGIEEEQLEFPVMLNRMLRSTDKVVTLKPITSPLGSYIILHSLIQRVHLVRELSLGLQNEPSCLPSDEVDKLEGALRSWTYIWQQAPESSLDPLNENGPIPFTSSSLLGLAYTRLFLNIGPFRKLETRDPTVIADCLSKCPLPERGPRLTPALIYAVHALSIPVRLGIDFIARSQAFFWSVRYCLASMECAVFLSKWLLTLDHSTKIISEFESRILDWVRDIAQEANDSMDADGDEMPPIGRPVDLSVAVLRLWSRFFRGNSQWPFINTLGLALQRYSTLI